MNLIVDIGNTRAKLAIFDQSELLLTAYSDNQTLSGMQELVQRYPVSRVIVSCVGTMGEQAAQALRQLGLPLVMLDADTPLPVRLVWMQPDTQQVSPLPATMGGDRIAALVGALSLWPGEPLLIVDAGTCVTYEVIDDEGRYLGGNIAPGVEMRLRSMHEHTALLPLVTGDGELPTIGRDTETCMRCGAVHGLAYEVEGYALHWRQRYPTLRVVLAGGTPLHLSIEATQEKNLVLKGLNAILSHLATQNYVL